MIRPRALLWGAVIAFALSARFVFETALVNRVPAAVAVCAAVVPAAIGLAALSLGMPQRPRLDRHDLGLAVVAGVLGVWASPFLVASVRLTDAPSGSEVLFLTSAVWGLLLVASGFFATGAKGRLVRLAGALLGVTAAVGILANWERPSSFSPFVKFPVQELVIVLGGVTFAVAARLLEVLVRKYGPLAAVRAVALPGAAAAVAAALVLAPGRLAALAQPSVWTMAGPAAIAVFALMLAWAEGLVDRPPEILAAAYFLTPVLLSALTLLEHATGSFGPDPIRWGAAGPSIVLAMAAAVLVARTPRPVPAEGPSRLGIAAKVAAVASAVAAAATLLSPDILVAVRGILSTGGAFRADFAMLGFETVGGWLAACCSFLVVAWAWRQASRVDAVIRISALAVAIAVWFPVHSTPTHTWNTWIPPEVQQDYGTEYATRTERPVSDPWEMLALGGAAVAGALLLTDRRSGADGGPQGLEVLTG